MNSNEFKRWLKKQGCSFDVSEGKGGHIKVYLGNKSSILPMHGKKELGTGLIEAIIVFQLFNNQGIRGDV